MTTEESLMFRLVQLNTYEAIDEVLEEVLVRYAGFVAEKNLWTFAEGAPNCETAK